MKADCQSIDLREDVAPLFSYINVSPSTVPSTTVKPGGGATKALRKRFPHMSEGEAFRRQVKKHAAHWSQFTAIAIHIPFSANEASTSSFQLKQQWEQQLLHLTEAIDRRCAICGGLWGQLDADIFGCIFPGKYHEGDRISEHIATALTDVKALQPSIGMATYPMLNFNRCRILPNAEKALVHSLLLGQGHTVHLNAVSLNISGDKFYQAGEYDNARKDFQLALQLDPCNVNIYNSLGVCYGMSGFFQKALEMFETAMWLDPKEVMAIHNAGIIHQLTGNPDQALDCLKQAFQLDSTIFESAFHAGILSLKTSQADQGAFFLEKAVQLNPKVSIAWRLLGDCYLDTDQRTNAVRAYKQAIKTNPDDAAALSALGYLYYSSNENIEIATVFCRQSTLLEPENGLYHQRLGRIYLADSNHEKALLSLRRAQALGVDSEHWIAQILEPSDNRFAYK